MGAFFPETSTVKTSTAGPSDFHAIDLSLLARVPKIDQAHRAVPPQQNR